MRKSMSRVAPKRAVHVYEDVENQGTKKMKTIGSAQRKVGGQEGVPRRPLADLKHQNSLVVASNKVKNNKSCEKDELRAASSEPQMKKPKIELITAKTNEPEPEPKTTTSDKEEEQNCQPIAVEDTLPEALENSIQKKEKIREQNRIIYSVPYYRDKIYNYLFRLEDRFQIPQDHLNGQEFTAGMRAVLIDWLAGLMDHMDLLQETFQLTVYIIDKYMSINKNTTKSTAQLVGLSSLFVAAKYEETEVLELTDLTIVCGHAWQDNDIKSMEREILGVIGYELGRPLAIHFIRRLSKISGASPMEHCYAKYFADTSLLSYQLCHVKPSKIAAASIFLGICVSRNRIDAAFWTTDLTNSSGYKIEDIKQIVKMMARTVADADAGKMQGIQLRYSCSQLYCVSIMPGCRAGGIINSF